MPATPKPKANACKFVDTMPVDAYILARQGMTNNAIAQTFGVNDVTFSDWIRKRSTLRYALERAREGGGAKTFQEYVYQQLPADLQKLWDEIEMWQDHESGMERLEILLSSQTKRVRQSLWMHAMVCCNFNPSEACRKLALSRRTVDDWAKHDPDFSRLLDEINWHKKNFFEEGLIRLVRSGNVLATVFANRTVNRDRGYSEKLEVNHSGTINHEHHHLISIDKLNLPLETRLAILDAIEAVEAADPSKTIDQPDKSLRLPERAASDGVSDPEADEDSEQ